MSAELWQFRRTKPARLQKDRARLERRKRHQRQLTWWPKEVVRNCVPRPHLRSSTHKSDGNHSHKTHPPKVKLVRKPKPPKRKRWHQTKTPHSSGSRS